MKRKPTARLTTEEVVEAFKKAHGNRYDYSRVEYTGYAVKVIIGCSDHGWFEQEANSHKSGRGCMKCGKANMASKHIIDHNSVIGKFKEVHGDRYDYSRVIYTGNRHKVTIGCSDHGWFEQSAGNHQSGTDCPECGKISRAENIRRLDTEMIVERFIQTHGNRYDYSRVVFKDGKKNVTIGCQKHGLFEQAPNNHSKGAGCPKCKGEANRDRCRYDQSKIIKSFKQAHGDLYDYSRVQYSGNTTKVTIGCPIHGWFEQIPKDHKRGIGCAQCGPSRCGKSRKVTLDNFIERSRKHHGDKFDYSLVDLEKNGMFDKIKIICPYHGVTLQLAHNHALGFGCKKCDAQRVGDMSKITHEQFIENSLKVHGNVYDYSKTKYTFSHEIVVITCKKHGDFEQQAKLHARGAGCSQCSQSRGERAIALWLKEKSIPYEVEKRFTDCLSPKGRTMKFDFYLPHYSALIEFDGHHHYREVEYFGGYTLQQVQQYDEVKNQYAKKKGMPLLRIPFFFIKDVPALLEQFLAQITAAA